MATRGPNTFAEGLNALLIAQGTQEDLRKRIAALEAELARVATVLSPSNSPTGAT